MKERELFLAALDIEDPAARQAHLKTECGDDAALLARVQALLASHEGQSQFLNTPVVEQIADGSEAGADATIAYESGSTHDDDPDATTFYSQGTAPMTNPEDDEENEVALGYLEPSTKPGSMGRLGHYEVLEVIGRGAFGTVLRAFDEKLHRVVAIKVMAPEMAATSPARKRFIREAQASAAIRHEHVVSVYAVEEKPLPYLVMEFIPGLTLQQRLDERGPLDVPTVLRIGKQIAEGLAAAHAQDLIHRDIKPANILLETGAREMVKVTDFGLARAADDASLTQSGLIAGTPMYMAPEQALGHRLDQRADLFSFGSVLYQMVSGRPPFRAPSMLAVLKRVAEETPRPIGEIIPETPQWLCDIIAKLHAKNPDDRYQSAREVADVLADCEVQLKASARLQDFSRIPSSKPASSAKWKLFTARGVVGAMLLLCVIIIIKIMSKDGTQTRIEVPDSATVDISTNRSGSRETSEAATSDDRSLTTSSTKTGWHGWPTEAPPPATAPFDAEQAKQHQEAWAKYFGVPVEYTNSIGMKFRLIPPGEFTMGSTKDEVEEALKFAHPNDIHWQNTIKSEAPQHKVILTQPIYLGVNEVTQAEYEKVMGVNPSHYAPLGVGKEAVIGMETTSHPVETVSWNDAAEFCAKLSQQEKLKPFYSRADETITPLDGTGYRLPTEAEWEYACRAGTTTKYWSGDKDEDLMRVGWFGTSLDGPTHAAGELKANPYGLYDIHGNVWEWVEDWWEPIYYEEFSKKPAIDPDGPSSASDWHVVRGGDWGDHPSSCRASYRRADVPLRRSSDTGFRVSLVVDAVKAVIASSNTIDSANAKRRYASDEWIDVIPLIDPTADKWDVPQRTGKNAWRIERGELMVGGDPLASKLVLPLDSDWPAFECEVEFTRRAGDSGFNVNLPTKVGECPLLFDPTGTSGAFLGSRAKGVQLKTGAQLETGKRATIRFDIRRQQDADHASVAFNGAAIGEWTGDRTAISYSYREGFPHDRRISLWIHPGGNEFVFHRIRVRMLDGGTAESLRPVPITSPVTVAKQELPPTFKNSIGMEFVIVPKGKSWLGGGKDKPGDKEVEIPADFYLGKYEVTQEEWTQVMGENPSWFSRTRGGKDAVKDISDADLKRFPVETVSWDECQRFVAKLNQQENKTGWVYRLPKATEWEYACRGGPMTDKADSAFDFYFATPTNNPLREQEGFGRNKGLNRTGKVGSNEANGLGIFDMHRNVWEWCDDMKEAADGNIQRVQMGGGWNHIRWRSAAANIESELPSHRSNALGLRLARVPSGTLSPEAKTSRTAVAPFTDADIQRIAALPAADQVEEFRKELKKRNPEFDGTLTPTIENDVVTGIEFFTNHVSDISPVRAFPHLTSLNCRADGSIVGMVSDLKPLKGMPLVRLTLSVNPVSDLTPLKGMPLTDLQIDNSHVADLSPLEGMPLKVLNCSYTKVASLAPLKGMPLIILWCNNTEIADLSPVKGMPLEWITIHGTKITDLSPLKGMPLTQIYLDFDRDRDGELLRSLTKLQKINDKSADEFRKDLD